MWVVQAHEGWLCLGGHAHGAVQVGLFKGKMQRRAHMSCARTDADPHVLCGGWETIWLATGADSTVCGELPTARLNRLRFSTNLPNGVN